MQAELLHTIAADGIRIDGALLQPTDDAASKLAIDAAICLPGVSATFYGSTMLEDLARPLLAAGTTVLWANTRGHDLVYTASSASGMRRQGAAYEIVDECRHDVTAWCELLKARGFNRIGLIGHSLGAIKSVYAAAHVTGLPIERVVAISPPRLCHAEFKSAGIEAFEEAIELANEHVAAGRGQTLIESRFPFPLLISARSYIDKYGPAERYDLARFAAKQPCPALFIYGGDELRRGGTAFAGIDDLVRSLADEATQSLDVHVIAGANHFYSGHRTMLADMVAEWLTRQADID